MFAGLLHPPPCAPHPPSTCASPPAAVPSLARSTWGCSRTGAPFLRRPASSPLPVPLLPPRAAASPEVAARAAWPGLRWNQMWRPLRLCSGEGWRCHRLAGLLRGGDQERQSACFLCRLDLGAPLSAPAPAWFANENRRHTFKHKWLVDEALTHCSWPGSGVRCYQVGLGAGGDGLRVWLRAACLPARAKPMHTGCPARPAHTNQLGAALATLPCLPAAPGVPGRCRAGCAGHHTLLHSPQVGHLQAAPTAAAWVLWIVRAAVWCWRGHCAFPTVTKGAAQ